MRAINVKLRNSDAKIPTKAHPSDAGFDLYASEDVVIQPGEAVIVPTGIAIELPEGYEAQIRPRSGVTVRTKLRVQLGTVDANYRGEIGVIVDNIERDSFKTPEDYEKYAAKGLDGSTLYDLSDAMVHTDSEYLPFGTYFVRKGERIAQLVIQKLPEFSLVTTGEISDTDRSGNGFGSSGVN